MSKHKRKGLEQQPGAPKPRVYVTEVFVTDKRKDTFQITGTDLRWTFNKEWTHVFEKDAVVATITHPTQIIATNWIEK
jgi:hypothetical protein